MSRSETELKPDAWWQDAYRLLAGAALLILAMKSGAPEWTAAAVVGSMLLWKAIR